MILVVAEKPSVGRDIARVLKAKSQKEACLYNDTYAVSWALGHLVTLYDPEDYQPAYKKWTIDTLPIIPQEIALKPIKKTSKHLNILKKLMNSKEVTQIICATDSGREGELIFRYIYQYIRCKKPVKRLWISSLTDEAILEGFQNLKDSSEYTHLFYSARCRSEADWLVGINATRAYTVRYGALLSVGRVQTPTLSMLVKRQKEINQFVPREYWEVEGDFEKYKGLWVNEAGEPQIDRVELAEAIVEKVSGKEGKILSVERQKKKNPPPLLYDLTTLQRECNNEFGWSADKTLKLAQKLYESKKLITYPRTDSRYLSEDMKGQVEKTVKSLENTKFQQEVMYVLDHLKFTKRIMDNAKVSDHHAIVPTQSRAAQKRLTEEEQQLYMLIVKRFLCVFYPNYEWNRITVTTRVEGEKFITKGNETIQLGWMELYKEKQKEKPLPSLEEGEAVVLAKAELLAKKTQPPKSYTESTLLSAMENAGRQIDDPQLKEQMKDSGLGTPATRAAIIERLLQVGYIKREKKALIPTEKGMQLIDLVPEQLKSPETTGRWEKGLASIARGQMETQRFMESINRYVHFIIQESARPNDVSFEKETMVPKRRSSPKSLGTCPVCGKGKVLANTKAYYCSFWKDGCKFTLWKNSLDDYSIKISDTMVRKLLKEKKISVPMVLRQTGENCTADLVLSDQYTFSLQNVTRIKE